MHIARCSCQALSFPFPFASPLSHPSLSLAFQLDKGLAYHVTQANLPLQPSFLSFSSLGIPHLHHHHLGNDSYLNVMCPEKTAKVTAGQSHLIPAPYFSFPQPPVSFIFFFFCFGPVFIFHDNRILTSFIHYSCTISGRMNMD